MRRLLGCAAAALVMAGPASAENTPAIGIEGVWINPHDDVAVHTRTCGNTLCGWVVWANPEAQSDARDGGVARLVGTELLENYRPNGRGSWKGTVFVPDMGRRYSSVIDQVSATQLRIKGCILGGLICRSQVWSRIERLPDA